MKKLGLLMMLLLLSRIALFCQAQTAGIEEKEVLRNEDVIFHQIDEHTWFGTGHLMANESLYLVEGETKAILIDAGTKIKDLDKLVASITDKPVTLVATHVHPDHTGSAIDYFPEIYINPADTIGIPEFMPNYKGKVCFLEDGEILDLGGRILEIVFTPGHTPGSTTFVDKDAANLISDKYQLSKYHTKFRELEQEEDKLDYLVPREIYSMKDAYILYKIKDIQAKIKEAQNKGDMELIFDLMKQNAHLNEIKNVLCKELGERIVLKM